MNALSRERGWRLALWGFVGLIGAAWPAQAQQYRGDQPAVTAQVDQERITVGDPFHYVVTVYTPTRARAIWSENQPVGSFETLDFAHRGPVAHSSGGFSDTLRYTLTVFSTGVHVIPPCSLSWMLEDSSVFVAAADSIPVTVVSVIEDEATDIRDIKDPKEIPDELPWYVWAGLVVLVLGAIAAGVYLYRRWKRPGTAPHEAREVERLPHDIALDELNNLLRREWLAQGKIKEHYSDLSEIIRRYIAARYGVAAMELTTTELLRIIDAFALSHDERHRLSELLGESDLVKFAKYIPDEARRNRSVPEAIRFVEHTRPAPQPVEATPPAAQDAPSAPVRADRSGG
jgi:hypothetical protein